MLKNTQLSRILKKLKDIDDKLNKPKSIDDYVSELEAKQLLGRGTTWFWERRRSGELPYTRLGVQVYYLRKDLVKYLEDRSSKS
tara:strand:+ start:107 stop:358 length:252 start_codon:yes stop_codon:yes gene_type:complete